MRAGIDRPYSSNPGFAVSNFNKNKVRYAVPYEPPRPRDLTFESLGHPALERRGMSKPQLPVVSVSLDCDQRILSAANVRSQPIHNSLDSLKASRICLRCAAVRISDFVSQFSACHS